MNVIKIQRNAPGSYSIIVDGVVRGDTSKAADGWNTNWCNAHGESEGSSWSATKREIVTWAKARAAQGGF